MGKFRIKFGANTQPGQYLKKIDNNESKDGKTGSSTVSLNGGKQSA